jgi:uncharacterized protein (TIGR00290 family)
VLALSWSGGKDCAAALGALRDAGTPPVVLLTTVDERSARIPHHGVPIELLRLQAAAAGLPLAEIPIPNPATNDVYAERMRAAFDGPQLAGVEAVAFGDLFLADLRRFREQRLAEAGLEAVFPLWGRDTAALAHEVAASFDARVVSVDPTALDEAFLGRRYDAGLLADLPAGVDPCGENGELHTFVCDCPSFSEPVQVEHGELRISDGFPTLDLRPSAPTAT